MPQRVQGVEDSRIRVKNLKISVNSELGTANSEQFTFF